MHLCATYIIVRHELFWLLHKLYTLYESFISTYYDHWYINVNVSLKLQVELNTDHCVLVMCDIVTHIYLYYLRIGDL